MFIAMAMIALIIGGLAWYDARSSQPDGVSIKITDLPANATRVTLAQDDSGRLAYRVDWVNGDQTWMSPTVFAQALYDQRDGRPLHFAFLNITSTAGLVWVSLGLLGQVLFAGRMILQWLASEKRRRSIVPTAFWWMSLIGASMLICYFIWRKDAVGVLGQATGWIIYCRNLWLIYFPAKPQADVTVQGVA